MNGQLNIIECLKWIFEKYYALQKKMDERNLFRIISITHNKNGECVARIQMTGRATITELAPQKIVSDDQLLEGFSRNDIRTLTFYATQEIKKPKHKILVQGICDEFNKIKFKLGKRGISTPLEKTAEEISLDKELLKDLSPEDAHTIGYTAATEQMQREREQMNNIQKKILN